MKLYCAVIDHIGSLEIKRVVHGESPNRVIAELLSVAVCHSKKIDSRIDTLFKTNGLYGMPIRVTIKKLVNLINSVDDFFVLYCHR